MPTLEKTRSPIVVFRERLLSRREELAHALEGSGVSPDRFIRAATTAMQMAPDLAECTFESMWIALLKACRDQLLPDGVQGAIVPFKRQATWIPMYRGLLNRFERSGHYKWIAAGFHRQGDRGWRVWIDEHGQHFLHEPDSDGKVIETYACATTLSGAFFISIVSEDEMKRIRAVSRAQREDSPWQKWPEEMMKKTALRRLTKILPMPAPVEDFMRHDTDDDDGEEEAPLPPRPRGAQAALEQFASDTASPAAPVDHDHAGETGGAQGAQSAVTESQQAGPPQSHSAAPEAGPAAADEIPQTILRAYQDGKAAKAAGHLRRAMPGEFRAAEHQREAIAWQAGFDGNPLPAWKQ
jgi:recombination protein RecT